LGIKDDGVGINPANKYNIFEPFFSTKPEVKGTGLGLSVSYGIIKKHNGIIEVKSTPGNGALFRIKLPLREIERNE
jgi:signal transduction histidine kinase